MNLKLRTHHKVLLSLMLIIGTALFLGSCSATQTMIIHDDNSGEIQFTSTLPLYLMETLADFSDLAGGAESTSPMDLLKMDEAEEAMLQNPAMTEVHLDSDDSGIIRGTLKFNDLEMMLAGDPDDPPSVKIVEIRQSGSYKTLTLKISQENYTTLEQTIPFLQNEFLQLFGPTYNVGVSREEYLDMVGFSFGDEAPGDLKKGTLKLTLKLPSAIQSQKGGRIIDGTTVEFQLPVLDLLMLSDELHYSVTY